MERCEQRKGRKENPPCDVPGCRVHTPSVREWLAASLLYELAHVCIQRHLSTAVWVTTSNLLFTLARESYHPCFPFSLSRQLACYCPRQGTLQGTSALATTLLPEHPVPGAPSLTPNPPLFVWIGPLGFSQVRPGKNYESVGRRFKPS